MKESKNRNKIRYAVAGLGWIAQEAVLPAFRNTDNSELTALVTDHETKAAKLSEAYGVRSTCSYGGYDQLMASGEIDAVFIALPNSMHADFSVRAARAGIHVLCEKPLASNSLECETMIRTAEEHGVRLMTAYRLHFEPGNLKVVEIVESGQIGEPRIFDSVFSQQVQAGNVRLRKDLAGGPLIDMGVYPINAARYIFRDEPIEVIAFGGNNGESRFSEVHEAASAILRFPGDRLATFTCSFGAAGFDTYAVIGTKGHVRLQPAFDFRFENRLHTNIGGEATDEVISRHDHFGPQLQYFSECILSGRDPEPSGREGLADVRIVDALMESMRTRRPVPLEPFQIDRRPDGQQEFQFPPASPLAIVQG